MLKLLLLTLPLLCSLVHAAPGEFSPELSLVLSLTLVAHMPGY